jgi:hypothetical protein
MTINQSRYGGAAEVGRAPTKEPRKDSKRPLITIAGGTAAVGGGLVASNAQGKLSGARANRDSTRRASNEAKYLWANRKLAANPTGIDIRRHHMEIPVNRGGNLPASYKQYAVWMNEKEKQADKAVRNVRRVRNVRTAGLAALASGLGVMGASAVHNERSRGTIGYKRPTNRLEALRQAGPTSAAESRYRRTNGM